MPFTSQVRNKRAASPAISMVILTSVTIMLVLVTGNYAFQVLERQRGASEFETVEKSVLSFDDAVRDVAWDIEGSRSARFTVNYGRLELIPSDTVKGLLLNVSVVDHPEANYSGYTGYVKYRISTDYLTFGDGYESYVLGNNETIADESPENLGRVLIKQESGLVNIILNYRIRAMKTSTVNITQAGLEVRVSYLDIWIIRMRTIGWSTYVGDIDLTARCHNITTTSYGGSDGSGYDVTDGKCNILAKLGNESYTATVQLDGEKVVFNFIVAEIDVST